MNFTMKALAAEEKSLRAKLAASASEAEQLRDRLPRLEAESAAFAASASAVGGTQLPGRASEVGAMRGQVETRLRDIASEQEAGETRLRELTDKLQAGPIAERAIADHRKCREWKEASERRVSAHTDALNRLYTRHRQHQASGAASIDGEVAALFADVGIESAMQPSSAATIDAAAHARTTMALERAIREGEARRDELNADLVAARQAESDAGKVARTALANQHSVNAELKHAEALASYLPALVEFLAAHQVAHEWAPKAPRLDSIVLQGIEPAKEAFRTFLQSELIAAEAVGSGVVAKAAKVVKGLLS